MKPRAFIPSSLLLASLSLVPCSPSPAQQPPAAPAAPADLTTEPLVRVLGLMTNRLPETRQRAYQELQRRKDPRAAVGLIELLRLPRYQGFTEIPLLLQELTGENFGVNWVAWNEWLTAKEKVELPPDFLGWKAALFRIIDPEFTRFLYPAVPLRIRGEEIVWGGVRKDAIPALTNPKQVKASEAAYLNPDDLVFGVEINGEARAYPHRIMDWHEMVNDVVGGQAVSLAYCTLCRSGILFKAAARGMTFTFGSSGLLYRSNKLMYDHQTESLWMTLPGEPVGGVLAFSGIKLEKLPVVVTTWEDWRQQHSNTLVLSLDTGYPRDYTPGAAYGDYFASPDTRFPVARRDARLPLKEEVFTLFLNGQPKAYPLATLRQESVLNDTLGGEGVVLVANPKTGAVRAYLRGPLRFRAVSGTDDKVETEDGGVWAVTEAALVSHNSGQRLPRVAGHTAYWFGWYAFFPQTLLYEGKP